MIKRIPPRDASALDWLYKVGACDEGVRWVEREGIGTVGEAWDRCIQPGWLVWGLDAVGWPARSMTGLACWFLRHTKLPNDRPFTDLLTDPRSRRALEVAEGWVIGRVGLRELTSANHAAWDVIHEMPCLDCADPGYIACMIEYHASEVAAWASTIGRKSAVFPACLVDEHLDQSVRWVAIRDGCNPDVARRAAMAMRLDGIRRLIIDPWVPDWTGPFKPKEKNT